MGLADDLRDEEYEREAKRLGIPIDQYMFQKFPPKKSEFQRGYDAAIDKLLKPDNSIKESVRDATGCGLLRTATVAIRFCAEWLDSIRPDDDV